MKKKTIHGTLVRMMSRGILLTGKSGSGKSSLALSLMFEGARLISDDIVEIYTTQDGIRGKAPKKLEGLIEIKGVGIVDALSVFGPSFIMVESSIDLVMRVGLFGEGGVGGGGIGEVGGGGIGEVGGGGGKEESEGHDRQPLLYPLKRNITLAGKNITEIVVGSEIDSNAFILVISDYIIYGMTLSPRLKKLLGPISET